MRKRLSWNLANVALLVVVVSASAMIIGCSSTGSGTTTLSTADAQAAAQTISGAAGLFLVNQSNWSSSGSSPTTVSYSTPYGASMSGTETIGTGTSSLTLTLTFNNYSDAATKYTVNGSATLTLDIDTTTGAVTAGTLTTGSTGLTLSGGKVTSQDWNLTDITSTGGNSPVYTFTGTVKCNGTSFDANSLSLGSPFAAQTGALAVLDGVSLMVNNTSSWTSTGTNTSSYNNSGVSMTATTVVGASQTNITMKITFASYADPFTGYTLTSAADALTVGETIDNATSNPVAASITGGPITFSGGPASGAVTTQTWNNVAATITSTTTVTGTVSSNGTLFDAKSIVQF